MNKYNSLNQLDTHAAKRVVAVGNFDGVHRGHQHLLDLVVQRAKELDAIPTVLTFSPHPTAYFRPDGPPFLLCKSHQKYGWIEHRSIDTTMDLAFNAELANQSPEDFVQHVLQESLQAVHVIVGEDFRFGHKRKGDTSTLKRLCAQASIGCTIFAPVVHGDSVISSTRVRAHVRQGELEEVSTLLGRAFEVTGKVIHGDARGRHLGFPTANVDTQGVLMPPAGIYVSTLKHEVDGPRRHACSYIGARPTYGDGPVTFETFVLDVPKGEALDLYELDVHIELLHRIRGDQAFESSDALVEQMHKDIQRARDYFNEHD